MSIEILHAGLILPQDSGRVGYAHIGVSSSGAYDSFAYRLLGSLMGHRNESYPALEILSGNLSLRVGQDETFAVVGNGQVSIDGRLVPMNTVLDIKSGENLYIESFRESPVYLSFDGMVLEKILGSVSYDSMSQIGNKPFKSGDIISIKDANKKYPKVGWFLKKTYSLLAEKEIRIISSCKSEQVESDFSKILLSKKWRIESLARSGIRLALESEEMPYSNEEAEILSSSSLLKSMPVLPGAIQFPKSGDPIILGPDSGVTGGYPVAGVVITADLYKLARLQNGHMVTFKAVSLDLACREYLEQEKRIKNGIVKVENLL